ncbi:PREDICTED: ankyrin repeat domain-containing protein 7-like [Priapulus caudatus]|uniref:Ankyrin repeat domain-containing protein 7-like n=1 Tax=Priapulus caudatus TaxID=37621 RepID=A0ABM1F6E0_PRICU|nr:PREDICTED: ankyrin repeat domain-containing protein 7-like [Priapulus caudatus]
MVEMLLSEGAEVNAADANHNTPLMLACHVGTATVVSLLLDYRADTTMKDDKGWMADDAAVIAGHHKCSQLIAEHNAHLKTPAATVSKQTTYSGDMPPSSLKPTAYLGLMLGEMADGS